jgi:hypothetical protein
MSLTDEIKSALDAIAAKINAIESGVIQTSNTSDTHDLNAASPAVIPITAAVDVADAGNFSVSGNAIQCLFSGTVEVHASIHGTMAFARYLEPLNLRAQLKKNATAQKPIGCASFSNFYGEPSSTDNLDIYIHLTCAMEVAENDLISVITYRESGIEEDILMESGTSALIVERIK